MQPLRPLRGYVVQPGHSVRFWAVFELLRPGRWRVADQVVFYTQGGTRYRQVIRLTYFGSVARKAAWPVPALEGACMAKLSRLGSRPLNPGHI